jgi:hypothetical protein
LLIESGVADVPIAIGNQTHGGQIDVKADSLVSGLHSGVAGLLFASDN